MDRYGLLRHYKKNNHRGKEYKAPYMKKEDYKQVKELNKGNKVSNKWIEEIQIEENDNKIYFPPQFWKNFTKFNIYETKSISEKRKTKEISQEQVNLKKNKRIQVQIETKLKEVDKMLMIIKNKKVMENQEKEQMNQQREINNKELQSLKSELQSALMDKALSSQIQRAMEEQIETELEIKKKMIEDQELMYMKQLGEQEKIIEDKERLINCQLKQIEEKKKKIEEQEEQLEKQNRKMKKMQTEQNKKINDQLKKIEEQEEQLEKQNRKIKKMQTEQNKKINDQLKKIEEQEEQLEKQNSKMKKMQTELNEKEERNKNTEKKMEQDEKNYICKLKEQTKIIEDKERLISDQLKKIEESKKKEVKKDEMNKVNLFKNETADKVKLMGRNIDLKSYLTLKSTKLLNDTIIETKMSLIEQKYVNFTEEEKKKQLFFFFDCGLWISIRDKKNIQELKSEKRFQRIRSRIEGFKNLIIPINQSGLDENSPKHWLLIIIEIPKKKILVFDSASEFKLSINRKAICKILESLLLDEDQQFSIIRVSTIQQDNSFDCGLFVLKHIENFVEISLQKGSFEENEYENMEYGEKRYKLAEEIRKVCPSFPKLRYV